MVIDEQPVRCPDGCKRRGLSDALDLRNVSRNPWLAGEQFSSRNELQELRKNCANGLYRKATEELELQMQIATIAEKRITKGSNQSRLSAKQNQPQPLRKPVLRVIQHGTNERPARLLAKYPILQGACSRINVWPYSLLTGLFIIYLVIKWCVVGILYYSRDYLLVKVKVKSYPSLNESCGRLIKVEPADALEKLRWYAELFHSLGAAFSSVPGICVTLMFILSACLLVFFVASKLLLNKKQVELRFMSFLLNPEEEKDRTEKELWQVAADLIHRIGVITRKNTTPSNRHRSLEAGLCPNYCKTCHSKEKFDTQRHLEFRRTVRHIVSSGLVRPANLTSHFHWSLAYCSRISNICSFFCGTIPCLFSLVFVTVVELYLKAKKRLAILDCERVNATLLDHWTIHLDHLASREHKRAYFESEHTGLGHLIHLLLIESTYYLTPMRLWFMLELIISAILIIVWSSLYTAFYVLDYISQFIWLSQIRHQIRDCFNTCLALLESTDPKDNSAVTSKKWAALTEKMTIVYLNMELFRRSHVNLRKMSGFLFEIWVILGFVAFAISYFILNELKPKFNIIIVEVTFAFGLVLNMLMASIAYKSRKIERMLKVCKSVVCRCSVSPIRNSYILDQWRRQILNGSEPWESFASSVFTIVISYEHCMAGNLYMAVLWMLVYIKTYL